MFLAEDEALDRGIDRASIDSSDDVVWAGNIVRTTSSETIVMLSFKEADLIPLESDARFRFGTF